jgi:hypothetical protein
VASTLLGKFVKRVAQKALQRFGEEKRCAKMQSACLSVNNMTEEKLTARKKPARQRESEARHIL